jgi:hypothetical protein
MESEDLNSMGAFEVNEISKGIFEFILAFEGSASTDSTSRHDVFSAYRSLVFDKEELDIEFVCSQASFNAIRTLLGSLCFTIINNLLVFCAVLSCQFIYWRVQCIISNLHVGLSCWYSSLYTLWFAFPHTCFGKFVGIVLIIVVFLYGADLERRVMNVLLATKALLASVTPRPIHSWLLLAAASF